MDSDGLDDGDVDDGGSEGAGSGDEQRDEAFEVDLDIDLEATVLTEMFQSPPGSLGKVAMAPSVSLAGGSRAGERNEAISWDF